MRAAKINGVFYCDLNGLTKARLIDIALYLKIAANRRMSRDRIVTQIYEAL
ncbi:hypothetical protein D3C71_1770330 [compost metagenome]